MMHLLQISSSSSVKKGSYTWSFLLSCDLEQLYIVLWLVDREEVEIEAKIKNIGL